MPTKILSVLMLLASGCSHPNSQPVELPAGREAAAAVVEARIELAQLDVERCEGDRKDAEDDLKRLSPTAVPEKTLVEARRRVADAEHNLKVARVRLKEQKSLLLYAKATGRLQ
jgi:multidrug resistance efflux pump